MRHAHTPLPAFFATRCLTAAACLLLTNAVVAQPAEPNPVRTSVDAFVAALSGGPPTRSFRRVALPDTSSSLCSEQPAAVPPSTGPGKRADARSNGGSGSGSGSNTRTLEVVPYAGDSTPGVNLSVQFAHGSDSLTAADRALLSNLAAALKTPDLARDSFAVAGHTDASGDARINLELSCARALAVRRYLAAQGVAPQRLSAYGFGSTRPLTADATSATSTTGGADTAGNRRVEVRRAPE